MHCLDDHRDAAELSNETKTIEFLPCGYARAADSMGRPITQYELCAPHAEQVVERERAKWREIVDRRAGR